MTVNPEAGMRKADNLKELREGVRLFGAAIHGIRPWSYEAWALTWTLDNISYFLSAAPPKQALDLSTKLVDKVLAKNACRGREGGPALISREIFEMCKEVSQNCSLHPSL